MDNPLLYPIGPAAARSMIATAKKQRNPTGQGWGFTNINQAGMMSAGQWPLMARKSPENGPFDAPSSKSRYHQPSCHSKVTFRHPNGTWG